jgi:hypothetical protein
LPLWAANLYPPVKQFETTQLQAGQQVQLRNEKREVLSRRAPRMRRSWRAGTRVLAMRLFGHARNDERLNPQGWAEPGDS